MFLSKSQQKAHTLTPMMQKLLLNFFLKKLPQMMRSQSYTKAEPNSVLEDNISVLYLSEILRLVLVWSNVSFLCTYEHRYWQS